jgi:hypothetical protein
MKKIMFLCCLVLMSCSVTKQSLSDDKVQKLKESIDSNKFHIVSKSARPMNTNSMQQLAASNLLANGSSASYIDLLTTSNYFIVNKDQLTVSLPFYGEIRSSGYGNNVGAIEFDGVPDKSSVSFNDAKNRYEMNYEFKNNNDYYKVRVEVYVKNAKTRIFVISGRRTSISYSGAVQDI